MYNALLFNEERYNVPQTFTVPVQPTTILQFDSYDLNTAALSSTGARILLQRLKWDSGVERQHDIVDVPLGDDIQFFGTYGRGKRIRAEGTIFHDSKAELQTLIDDIKKNLRGQDRELDVTIEGVTRRYAKATLVNMGDIFADREGYDATRCPFSLLFQTNSHGVDWQYTSDTQSLTTSPETQTITTLSTTNGKPIIILIIGAANSMTEITIGSDTNGGSMTITRSFAAGEALVIDCEEQTVEVAGTAVDFTGKFLQLDPGDNVLRYTVTSTSHSIAATIKHRNAYL